jgi:electron transfer flavoprotein alpha subunit
MSEILINHKLITKNVDLIKLCPFGAIEEHDGKLVINEGCRMCHLCVKKGPPGVFEFIRDVEKSIDKSVWTGVVVFVEYDGKDIHPVTFELIGEARKLADKLNHPVYALFPGNNIKNAAEKILRFKVDKVFVYDCPELEHYSVEPYTNVFEDFIAKSSPSIVLVGGTAIGRSLAPRIAARMKTGLTADCTSLDVDESTDLDQIRPAFGGNIMAHIRTTSHRPQFATVRYKIFDLPQAIKNGKGEIVLCSLPKKKLESSIVIKEIREKPKIIGIEEAERIIAVGRAFAKKSDIKMAESFAAVLNAQIAGTRPTIESGWIDPRRQIGLSGRTVKPKLLITCGISGSVQFVAGMSSADCIVAINKDKKAPIFKVAHYGIVGDIYEVLPRLMDKIEKNGSAVNAI